MARPHLENAAPIWSPDLTKDVTFLCIYILCVCMCGYVYVCACTQVGACGIVCV